MKVAALTQNSEPQKSSMVSAVVGAGYRISFAVLMVRNLINYLFLNYFFKNFIFRFSSESRIQAALQSRKQK